MSLILSGTDGLSDVDGTAATPAIRGTDANTGIFFPAADTIAFAEGGAESMRITADGSVLIGGTTDTGQTSGFLTIQRTDGAPGLDMFRNDTSIADTDVLTQIRFLGNDTTSNTAAQLAYIRATASGTHSAGDNPTDLVFATTPDGTSSVAEAGRITESGAYILKGGILNPGGTGITFPASQSASSNANTLDDYEEGTWTPSVQGTGTAGTATYSSRNGKYVKIGTVVHLWFNVDNYSLAGAVGTLIITGMPFTPDGANPVYTPGTVKTYNIDFNGNYIVPQTYDTNTYLALLGIRDNDTWTEVQVQNVGGLYITGQITYRVA